ncbi:pitrilysin family protein [Labrenzia sp. ac12]|uniref:M16 family metallopeptidase n=2 Tax=Stappiaceae TaxID=2821832 RepID=UPI0012AA0FB1|nr:MULTISPECIES: pitrilysin family protein [unclassified Labrenzia]QFS95960.1 Protease 3 precursor [Labrenzia sp. THAF191b]QFT02275.1 Protease 3 precursor [Labrenzia sp. THAF191a]QFT13816.1 Protease 3 precursor [Labrenzia sp. THAF187b]
MNPSSSKHDKTSPVRRLKRSIGLVLMPALLLGGGMALVPGSAFSAPATAGNLMIAPNLESFTLDNGLQVVVIPDRRAPVVTHMIWYKVGSADEPEGQSGVAHFLEHLMFKGTHDHPNGEFSKMVADRGGQENAFTSTDYTAYFQKVAKQHLPLMMKLEADRMENLVLSDEVVTPERDVVLEERRMRVDSEPGSRLQEALNSITFVNHPYGSPVIGWQSEIEALNKEAAIAFYDRFYTPNNAVVVIAGDVDVDAVRKLAQETYGKVARRAEPGERLRPAEPPLAGERRIAVSDPRVRQESLSQIWIVPSQTTGEGRTPEALDILSYILGEGPSSRLHKALVLDQEAALSAGAYYQGSALDNGRFGLYAVPRPGYTLEDMERLIATELQKLLETGVTEEEVKRARNSMVASAIYAQDSQSGLARLFGGALTTGQTIENVQTWPSQVQAVTPEDVLDAARTYLAGLPVVGELRMEPPVVPDAAQSDAPQTKDKS